MKFIWNQKYDENGNTIWEAKCYEFVYRILKKLKNDKIVYYEDSSPCLWLCKYSPYREEWDNIDNAKYDMYRHFLNIMNTV